MHVMDIYSVKQPQNIIKIKLKQHKIGKKLNKIYIIAFMLSVRQSLVQLVHLIRKSCSVNLV